MGGSKAFLLWITFWVAHGAYSADLLTVYEAAVLDDPRLKVADLKVGVGRATQQQAAGDLLPQLRGTASVSENRQDLERDATLNTLGGRESFPGERYSLTLTQPLFNLAKYYRWQRQQAITQQFQYERNDVLQQLMLDVVEGYFMVLQAEDDLALVNQAVATNEGLLAQVENLHDKQLAKVTELLEVRASLDKLLADRVEAESLVSIARERLHELTGQNYQDILPLREDASFARVEGSLEQWLAKVKSGSASLASLSSAVEAQSQALKEQKAGRLPVVDLQASHQKSDLGFENSPRPTTATDVVGVNVSMPLFTSGVISGRVSESRLRLEMAQNEFEIQYRSLIKEARDALLRANAAVRRIAASRKAVESAAKSAEAMDKGFKLGAVTSADVLDAKRGYFQSLRDRNASRYDYILNRMRLLRISGLASEAELLQMNSWLAR